MFLEVILFKGFVTFYLNYTGQDQEAYFQRVKLYNKDLFDKLRADSWEVAFIPTNNESSHVECVSLEKAKI
jgi:hypothetical protein